MSGRFSVAFDATPAINGRTGIALYVTSLAAALRDAGVTVKPFAIGRAEVPPEPGWRHVPVPWRVMSRIWAAGGPPRPERLVGGADVVHATALLPPPSRLPIVATVHDLAAIECPGLHERWQVQQVTAQLKYLSRADVIISVSGATADVLRDHGVEDDRIAVVHSGLVGLGEPSPDRVVDGPYLLAVGEQRKRKGLAVLVEALAHTGPDVRLVHAGPPSDESAHLAALVEREGLSDRVRFLGYVARADLAALYRDASAFCYPSYAEGFGLPVLEAMAVGVPVIASDIAVLREVAGDAALFAPPGDVPAWAAAIERAVRDDSERDRLVATGSARAAAFTWKSCAEGTIEAYERAMDGR